MKIARITGREIFDSRGFPTIACDVEMEDGVILTGEAPAGLSRGAYEATELRDGDERFFGKGVTKSVHILENKIAPLLVGKEPDMVQADVAMVELDDTETKSNLGANTMLAASIAVFRAQAYMHEVEDYELIAHLSGAQSVTMPYPMFNILNGGLHSNAGTSIQEVMLLPMGAQNCRAAFEATVNVHYHLKELLKKNKKSTAVGDEGGFAAHFKDEKETLDFVMLAIEAAGYADDGTFVLALDVAASHLYNKATKGYAWYGDVLTADQLVDRYAYLAQNYPLFSIEDGLHEDDWKGWGLMSKELGQALQLVGDDIFATNPERVFRGIQEKIADGVIIKPNQIGTLTETLQTIQLCKENDVNIIISHRSGETNDSFIADLAVGVSAGQIKAGGCTRGERIAKYNRLLAIEEELTFLGLDE